MAAQTELGPRQADGTEERHIGCAAGVDCEPEVANRQVHGVACHEPVGRVLAAGDAHEPGALRRTAWLRESFAVSSAVPPSRGRRPTKTAMTSSNLERRVERLVDMVEEVLDVGVRRRRMVEAVVPVGVGRADDPAVPQGATNSTLFSVLKISAHCKVDAVLRHDKMDSLGRPHDHRIGDPGEALHLGRPDAGGVDHRAGPHVELAAGLEIVRADPSDPGALVEEVDTPAPKRRPRRARPPSAPARGETGVVDLGVEVADTTGQRVGEKSRHRPQARSGASDDGDAASPGWTPARAS